MIDEDQQWIQNGKAHVGPAVMFLAGSNRFIHLFFIYDHVHGANHRQNRCSGRKTERPDVEAAIPDKLKLLMINCFQWISSKKTGAFVRSQLAFAKSGWYFYLLPFLTGIDAHSNRSAHPSEISSLRSPS